MKLAMFSESRDVFSSGVELTESRHLHVCDSVKAICAFVVGLRAQCSVAEDPRGIRVCGGESWVRLAPLGPVEQCALPHRSPPRCT